MEKGKKGYEAVDNFLENRFKSVHSIKTYKTALYKYFNIIKKDPETYFDNKEDRYKEYEKDMWNFIKTLEKENKAPLSIKVSCTAVRQFMKKNRFHFDGVELDEFAMHYSGGTLADKPKEVSSDDIKVILSNADLRLKTLYLFMASSGMRRGELSQLKIGDVDMTKRPTTVNIKKEYVKAHKGKKTGRITFISDEATYHLKQWLKVRPDHIRKTCKRLNKQGIIHKDPDDDTIFPMDASGFQGSLNRLLEKAGAPYNEKQMRKGDKKGKPSGRYLFTCHGFRRFFRSNLNEVVPVDYVEILLGHKNYLTDQYRYGYEKKLREYYLKGMHTLEIFSTGVSQSEMDRKDIQHEKEMSDIRKDFEQKIKDMKDALLIELSDPEKYPSRPIHKEKIEKD